MGVSKTYSLKSRTALEALMSSGVRIKAYPVHLVCLPVDSHGDAGPALRITFSAPKRIHRSAVARNTVKRRMREAFRPLIPQMEAFIEETGTAYACMLIYVGPEIASVSEIAARLKLLLERFTIEFNPLTKDEQSQEPPQEA